MLAEDAHFPTIEQVASRSGVSLRSVYRYFADSEELLAATIKRSREIGTKAASLKAIGQGPYGPRLDDFVATRLRIYELAGGGYRASIANAARIELVRVDLEEVRVLFSQQFERQFAPELDALPDGTRQTAFMAGDLLTQFDSIDVLRRHHELSIGETESFLRNALDSWLKPGSSD